MTYCSRLSCDSHKIPKSVTKKDRCPADTKKENIGLPFLAIGGLSCGFHEKRWFSLKSGGFHGIIRHSLPQAHNETEGFVLN